jgi:hypothetical protein
MSDDDDRWRAGYESGVRVGQAQIIAAFCAMVAVQTEIRVGFLPHDATDQRDSPAADAGEEETSSS